MSSIAIIGASNDAKKYGHAAVLAFLDAGWDVFPVNPNETEVSGRTAYKSVADVPQKVDWISLYVPPPVGIKLLPEFQLIRAEKIWLNPGSENADLLSTARELGLPVTTGCSIRAIGKNPYDYF